VGGIVALVLGSLVLTSGDGGTMRISLSVILTVAVVTVLFFRVRGRRGIPRRFRRKPITGREGLLGSEAWR